MTTRRHTQSVVILITAAVAAAAGYFGARLTATESTAPPTTQAAEEVPAVGVVTAALRRGELADTSSAFGVVQARASDAASMTVPFDAVAKAVHVSVGQTVAAGQALADLEPSPDARLQRRQAEQAYAAADRAANQARQRRSQQLATNADVATAEQARDAARTQLDAQKARGDGEAVSLSAAGPGVVTAVGVQAGQIVTAGTPIVTVAPDDSVEVRLGVDPADLAGAKSGSAVTLLVPNSTNTLAGTIDHVSRALNPQRLCDVFVRPNAATGLPLGTFVEGRFVRSTAKGLIVPRVATQLEDGEWCVYTVKDDKAARHVVKLGASDGRDIVVTGDGLAEDSDVVVERDGELADGTAVKVEPPEEDAK